ncbi:MAG TPA: hypothetical protein LFW21_04985 [Rickettsia endosymbiont of Pyrocoelia pectoralis]|nr:hypothetical protein [Rickettsia endosymbiont of Pyrocoelia pectoralis]
MSKSENYYYKFLQDILLKTLEQNKAIESYIIQKDFDNALAEMEIANERLEECSKVFSLLEAIKAQFPDKDEVYN